MVYPTEGKDRERLRRPWSESSEARENGGARWKMLFHWDVLVVDDSDKRNQNSAMWRHRSKLERRLAENQKFGAFGNSEAVGAHNPSPASPMVHARTMNI